MIRKKGSKCRKMRNKKRSLKSICAPVFRTNAENQWEFNNLLYLPRTAVVLTGLITFDGIFEERDISSLKELAIFSIFAGSGIINWVLQATTMIAEFHKDFYSGLTAVPTVLNGAVVGVLGLSVYVQKKKIMKFMKELKYLWDREVKRGLDDEVIANIKKNRCMARLYCCLFIGLCVSFLMRPIYEVVVYMWNGRHGTFFDGKVLPVTYPFAVDTGPKYILCNLWEGCTVAYVIIGYIAGDIAFLQLSGIISALLQVIGIQCEKLVPKGGARGNQRRLMRRLHRVAEKHSNLLLHCRKLQEIFSPIVFSILMFVGVCLAVCVLNIQKESYDENYRRALLFLFYFVCVIIQISLYCDSAERISHWSGDIARAVYDCDWLGCSKSFQKSLLLIMMRAQNNYKFKIYGMYELNRALITKIVMLAYNLISMVSSINSPEG